MASKKRQGYQAIPDDNSTDTLEESEDYYHIDNDDDSLKRVIDEINAVNEAKRSGASANDFDAWIHLVKGNIGTGLLALPVGFSKAGYGLASVVMTVMAVVAVHCMILLVKSSQYLVKELTLNRVKTLDYGQVAQFAVEHTNFKHLNLYCGKIKRSILAKVAKYVINVFLIITQFGFCTVYFVFCAENLQKILSATGWWQNADLRLIVLILFFPFLLLSLIRDLRTLAPLMMLANILMVGGLIVGYCDMLYRFATEKAAVNCVGPNDTESANQSIIYSHTAHLCGVDAIVPDVKKIFIFFGVAIYAFEGIGVVLPLENKMKKPEHFKAVVYSAMSVVAILYLATGLLGYLAYGDCAQGNVLLNLNADNINWLSAIYHSVQLCIGFVIYSSFAIQFYVPLDFLEPVLLKWFQRIKTFKLHGEATIKGKLWRTMVQYAFRFNLVVIVCGLALIDPEHLDDYISLVGAFASSALALIFPTVIHLLVFACGRKNPCKIYKPLLRKEQTELASHDHSLTVKVKRNGCAIFSVLWIVKDVCIMCIGLIGAVIGTYSTLDDIVTTFTKSSKSAECLGVQLG